MSTNRFSKFFEYILLVEGGYTYHKNDKGGETKYGITKETARRYGYQGEMKDLTKQTAQKIFEARYYKANKLDQVKNDKMALSILDFVINSGRYGIKKAQEAINKIYGRAVVSVDGSNGPQTLKYLNQVEPAKFLAVYHSLQREFYNAIVKNDQTQKVFLNGWLNRVKIKENYIKNV